MNRVRKYGRDERNHHRRRELLTRRCHRQTFVVTTCVNGCGDRRYGRRGRVVARVLDRHRLVRSTRRLGPGAHDLAGQEQRRRGGNEADEREGDQPQAHRPQYRTGAWNFARRVVQIRARLVAPHSRSPLSSRGLCKVSGTVLAPKVVTTMVRAVALVMTLTLTADAPASLTCGAWCGPQAEDTGASSDSSHGPGPAVPSVAAPEGCCAGLPGRMLVRETRRVLAPQQDSLSAVRNVSQAMAAVSLAAGGPLARSHGEPRPLHQSPPAILRL